MLVHMLSVAQCSEMRMQPLHVQQEKMFMFPRLTFKAACNKGLTQIFSFVFTSSLPGTLKANPVELSAVPTGRGLASPALQGQLPAPPGGSGLLSMPLGRDLATFTASYSMRLSHLFFLVVRSLRVGVCIWDGAGTQQILVEILENLVLIDYLHHYT